MQNAYHANVISDTNVVWLVWIYNVSLNKFTDIGGNGHVIVR
jgi:hypothetical protein